MRKGFFLLVSIAAFTGCTPSAYQRSADRQVQEILRDRSETTLGYQPQVESKTTVHVEPTKRAYAKIPTTPLPPPAIPPLEPVTIQLDYGKLGPEYLPNVQAPTTRQASENYYSIEAAERRAAAAIQLGPPNPNVPKEALDLFRALEYATTHSRSYMTEMDSLYITTLDVTLQRHLFEPRPFASTGLKYTGGQREVQYRSALTATNTIGVRQQLPYGGEIVAEGLVDFVNTVSGNVADGESASLALTASVPLLRGAGMVNLEPLISSERQVIYQIRAFEDFRRSFVVDVATRYFNLLTLQQQLNNQRFNYSNLAALTARTQALYEADRQNFLEVQRSQQAQLGAQSSLVDAEANYQSAVDSFKVFIGMPTDTNLEIVPEELDVHVPQVQIDEVVDLARKYRLDLQTARDTIEDAQRNVSNAKNGLLPDLNLTAGETLPNRTGSPTSDVDIRNSTYNAGVTLDLPLDRVAERNTYRRSLIQLEQAQRRYEDLQQNIANSARDALRGIRQAETNIRIQQLGIDLALRRLDYSNELLRQGQITARDVVEAQSSLLAAQDAFAQARASLQISILQYLRQTGTLRVDPEAGALGQTLDRAALELNKSTPQR